MSLFFEKKKKQEVNVHINRLLSDCPEGRRLDCRIKHVLVGMVVPIVDRHPRVDQAFAATTKDFSGHGVGMVFQCPDAPAETMLGFCIAGKMVFFRAEAKHVEPIGGGFYLHGFELFEVISLEDYPELEPLKL
jgi:hypothetical protein